MTELNPRLLKKRIFHSRLFIYTAVLMVFVSSPRLAAGEFPRECMMWAGYVLVALGVLGRAYCSVFIGGRKNETIVREGPYAIVRNPLYVFSFMALLGVGLQSGMLFMLLLLMAAFLAYYPAVVAKEEAYLRHMFGEAYEAYMREVPRWKPDFKLWSEPQRIECQPPLVRRTLYDASVFFLPLPIFSIIHALQSQGILPIWFMLP